MAERPDEELATGELSAAGLSTGELLAGEVSIDGMCGVYYPAARIRSRGLRPGPAVARRRAGVDAPRAVRRAAVPLRHPPAVVPEEPDRAGGGPLAGGSPQRPVRVHGG